MNCLDLAEEINKKKNKNGFITEEELTLIIISMKIGSTYEWKFKKQLNQIGLLSIKNKTENREGYYFESKKYEMIKKEMKE